ncbi:hypothetical protein [Flavobacterium defluvii]|uniref:hypothetical protein n=1 Tax=Flavobacterium defluvii TaxID=370979 RepID=UPI001114EB63|nr:hypothetical protein [Flavobacterium defluvii]
MKTIKNLDILQKFAIAIPVLFFLSCIVKHYLENFRGTLIYAYGSTITFFLSLFLVLLSLVNSVLILIDLNTKPIPKFVWFLLSMSIFFLFAGLIITIGFDIA